MPTVADVLRRYGPGYLAAHEDMIEPHAAKVLRQLMACRTPGLGGHVWKCTRCDHHHYRYHSCRNRHCPTCGGPAKGDWLDRMLDWKLPVTYQQAVFTLPHGSLLALVFLNARALFDLLFRSAWRSLADEAERRFGIRLGAVIVLHTWGQRMNPHVHVHVVFPVGGLALDGSRWIGPAEDGSDLESFLKVDELADRFRKLFLDGLDRLHRRGELFVPDSLRYLLPAARGPLSKHTWVVYCERPPEHLEADAALKYLANYVRGTAISDKRVLDDDGRWVTIRVKDYRNGGRRIRVTMTGQEFVRRFLTHILPPRAFRVRYFGLLTNVRRKKDLPRCRELLGVADGGVASNGQATLFDTSGAGITNNKSDTSGGGRWDGDQDVIDELASLRLADDSTPAVCPKCGHTEMVWLFDIRPRAGWRARLHMHTFPKAARREESAVLQPMARPP